MTKKGLHKEAEQLNKRIEDLTAERDELARQLEETGLDAGSDATSRVEELDGKIIDLTQAKSALEERRSRPFIRRITA